MTRDQALEFLREHQPLPDDAALDEATAETYDEVRKYFEANPDPACVDLFIGSFGDGLGLGIYQLIEDTLDQHPKDVVVQAIEKGLRSPFPGVRYWSANLVTSFPDERFLDRLRVNLKSENPDTRSSSFWALLSLAALLKSKEARAAVLDFYTNEADDHLRANAADLVQDLKRSEAGGFQP